ncbi:MAG: ABC transporter permease [Saprospiraceae bacterium]|nr:ABC transporter permease [Saprospiraceae bacterium]
MSNKAALWFLGLLLFLAVFRDLIANGRPLYCKIGGESYWPGFHRIWFVNPHARFDEPALNAILDQQGYFDEAWKNLSNYDEAPVFAFIPFTPGEYPSRNALELAPPGSIPPGAGARFRHWLGTDSHGRDIAATLVSGARVALLTGSVAMGMALLIGLLLGTIAGYFGDDRLKVRRGRWWLTLLGIPVAIFFAFTQRQYEISVAETSAIWWETFGIFASVIVIFNGLGWVISHFAFFSQKVTIPADLYIMRLAEIFNAIPKLVAIIAFSVLMQRQSESIWLLIGLIGIMSWTGMARYVRAELLRVRELEYVTAARGLGLPDMRILLRHALPNAMRPVLVALALGVAGAVMLEASLSFLGFGGDALKGISWGSLLSRENAQANPVKAWWVMLFPGLMICLTVLAFNHLAEKWNKDI